MTIPMPDASQKPGRSDDNPHSGGTDHFASSQTLSGDSERSSELAAALRERRDA